MKEKNTINLLETIQDDYLKQTPYLQHKIFVNKRIEFNIKVMFNDLDRYKKR